MPEAARPQIAKEITRLHVEATNAPPSFVHVIILDVPPGVHYTAGEPDTHTTLINGTIRAGRSLAVRQNLMKAISQSRSSLTGQPQEQLLINITEVDASTVMEAGVILPQPGEEAAWFEHNRARKAVMGNAMSCNKSTFGEFRSAWRCGSSRAR